MGGSATWVYQSLQGASTCAPTPCNLLRNDSLARVKNLLFECFSVESDLGWVTSMRKKDISSFWGM